MKINLRKANAIQSDIRKAISQVKLESNVGVNEFMTDVEGAVMQARSKYLDAVKLRAELNEALYEIRKAVGNVNAQQGVSDILAEVQMIDAHVSTLALISEATPTPPSAEVIARIEKVKGANTSIYGVERLSTFAVGVLSDILIDSFKQEIKSLKRKKQVLQDKLLAINVQSDITLSDSTVELLSREGIL